MAVSLGSPGHRVAHAIRGPGHVRCLRAPLTAPGRPGASHLPAGNGLGRLAPREGFRHIGHRCCICRSDLIAAGCHVGVGSLRQPHQTNPRGSDRGRSRSASSSSPAHPAHDRRRIWSRSPRSASAASSFATLGPSDIRASSGKRRRPTLEDEAGDRNGVGRHGERGDGAATWEEGAPDRECRPTGTRA